MFTVKCALEEELKQSVKDDSFEYHQRQTNWSEIRTGNFIKCAGFQQNFSLPTRAPKYSVRYIDGKMMMKLAFF